MSRKVLDSEQHLDLREDLEIYRLKFLLALERRAEQQHEQLRYQKLIHVHRIFSLSSPAPISQN